ncbi:MAG: hypothetical protein ACE5JI_22635, partial [Acidobacteriota bacterium]
MKKEYDDRLVELEEWFEAARHYAQAVERGSTGRFERDQKLEALARVTNGDLPLIVFAQAERDIKAAVAFAEKQQIQIILAGGAEAAGQELHAGALAAPGLLAAMVHLEVRDGHRVQRVVVG